MASITDKSIAKAARNARATGEDVWINDGAKGRGTGVLEFRAKASGSVITYFRYTDASGKRDRLQLGTYDVEGVAGLTLKATRAKAGELSKLYQSGVRDLRAHLDHESAEATARIEEARRSRAEAERLDHSGSLEKLCEGYVAHLARQGKVRSAQDTRNIFKRNVLDAFPKLAAMRANMIEHTDVAAMLAALVDKGIGRTAGKLRSFGSAAYAAALQADRDPTIHPDLHGFALKSNPFALVSAKHLSRMSKPRERHLSESELRAFLIALDKREGIARDAILLGLLLGGQRPTQLLRVKPADVDLDAGTITLLDPKGARRTPRVHVLPLTKRAADILSKLLETRAEKPYLLSSYGRVPLRTDTLSEIVVEIRDAMLKEKSAREPFDHRDLRRTTETMLARMGVTREVRAQLLSHGLGGVQQLHYDKHEYMDEKRAALEKWGRKLQQIVKGEPPSNVVRLRA